MPDIYLIEGHICTYLSATLDSIFYVLNDIVILEHNCPLSSVYRTFGHYPKMIGSGPIISNVVLCVQGVTRAAEVHSHYLVLVQYIKYKKRKVSPYKNTNGLEVSLRLEETRNSEKSGNHLKQTRNGKSP